MDELKQFRQYGSITPGHPEVHLTSGVETSTGPLGQGVANSVGLAMAQKHMQTMFNKPHYNLINHHNYCLVGDGDLMEGVSQEAFSLAGHLKLDNLTFIYDSNDISLEGVTTLSFTEDTAKKFEAMGYYVDTVQDGNNLDELEQKLLLTKHNKQKPSLLIVKTKIGYASSLEGSEKAHGKPLNKQEINLLKQNLNFEHTPFTVDDDVLEYVKLKQKQNDALYNNKLNELKQYEKDYASLYEQFQKMQNSSYETVAVEALQKLKLDDNLPLRDIAHLVLQEVKLNLPQLIGGTADVAPSTKAYLQNLGSFLSNNYSGKNLHYGVREHAMASVANGIALYGGLRTFVSTYLAFTDYMRAGMRMSAIMSLPVLYFITHDSVLIGEDGATHQPVEQLVGLRAMPNMNVFRPCNKEEVIAAFITYLQSKSPTTVILSKSSIKSAPSTVKESLKGASILKEASKKPKLILIGTGSEVEVCLQAQQQLEQMDIPTRVVSMPCMNLFEMQDEKYKNKVLPKSIKARIAVEAGSAFSFYKYVGQDGNIVSVDGFGASGKKEDLQNAFQLTNSHIVTLAKTMLKK
jgi:transketolase